MNNCVVCDGLIKNDGRTLCLSCQEIEARLIKLFRNTSDTAARKLLARYLRQSDSWDSSPQCQATFLVAIEFDEIAQVDDGTKKVAENMADALTHYMSEVGLADPDQDGIVLAFDIYDRQNIYHTEWLGNAGYGMAWK